jgi:hypothetical protein
MFLSVFSFAATAIVHCFLLDEESGGNGSTPECMKAFLDHHDKINAKKEEN